MVNKNMPQSWIVCRNLEQWHDWLGAHHDTEPEAWLQIQKAGSMERGFSLGEAVEEALCFGWIDSRMYSLDQDKYILRFTPRKPGSNWSMINKKRAEALISEGRMTEAGMAPIREAQANGKWQAAYSSKETPDMPEDLIRALQEDPLAQRNFYNWSNSEKLQAAGWVEMSKRPITRTNRIIKIVSCANRGEKLF